LDSSDTPNSRDALDSLNAIRSSYALSSSNLGDIEIGIGDQYILGRIRRTFDTGVNNVPNLEIIYTGKGNGGGDVVLGFDDDDVIGNRSSVFEYSKLEYMIGTADIECYFTQRLIFADLIYRHSTICWV
jgi:hypothetical protein